MHYIIGTRISTHRDPRNPRGTTRLPEDFKPNLTYELFHIKKERNSDKMRYVFLSTCQTEAVGLTFDTISDADKFISGILNEQLPNYEEIYANNST